MADSTPSSTRETVSVTVTIKVKPASSLDKEMRALQKLWNEKIDHANLAQGKRGECSTMRVSFPSEADALLVFRSVVVDEEIRPKAIYRHLRVDGNTLECYFSASEIKNLRVATSAFLEMLAMATDTLAQFQLSEGRS